MNVNMIHNILNFFGLIVGSLLVFDWTGLGLSPEQGVLIGGYVLLADKIIKISMNLIRDGITGLWKVQPPVEK
jgi:hypothetical protein